MADVRVSARDRRDRLGEGALWSARQDSLFWVDILGRRINRMALADGRVESFEQPHYAAWIIEREAGGFVAGIGRDIRSEEHTSELQSLMRNSYAVFCLKKKKDKITQEILTMT